MDITRIWSNDKQLQTLTGLEKNEAIEILAMFESEVKSQGRMEFQKTGRPAKLDTKGVLVMLMMFYRHYITLEALGALFNLSDSNVKRWLDSSEEILRSVLEKKSLSHLIAPNQKLISKEPLSDLRKSTLMALSNR